VATVNFDFGKNNIAFQVHAHQGGFMHSTVEACPMKQHCIFCVQSLSGGSHKCKEMIFGTGLSANAHLNFVSRWCMMGLARYEMGGCSSSGIKLC
jgi:hypothetical protein